MNQLTLKEIAIPLIKAIDAFNFLLKSHHRRVAIMSYYIGVKYGLDEDELADLVIAAAIHDIGALSVEERDHLIREDVEDPSPHCNMAFRILSQCKIFKQTALILKHHHIHYDEIDQYQGEKILIQSHILHLADRIDIYLSPDEEPLSQVAEVTEQLRRRTGRIFHPEVFAAYEKASADNQFWLAIDQISMEEILNKVDFSWNLEVDQEKIISFASVISKIVDYRSHYTATHSYTVGHVAFQLAKLLKHDDEYAVKLLIAGFLHDIGKIGIDPSIIEKTGKLTEEERNQVKLHVSFTGEILDELNKYDWFKDIVRWAMHHHEKGDGSGYPSGWHKGDIDEGTFILAYSDVICALMEARPYRRALGVKEAFEIIDKEIADKLDRKIYKKIKKNIKIIAGTVFQSQMEASRVYKEPLENLLSM